MSLLRPGGGGGPQSIIAAFLFGLSFVVCWGQWYALDVAIAVGYSAYVYLMVEARDEWGFVTTVSRPLGQAMVLHATYLVPVMAFGQVMQYAVHHFLEKPTPLVTTAIALYVITAMTVIIVGQFERRQLTRESADSSLTVEAGTVSAEYELWLLSQAVGVPPGSVNDELGRREYERWLVDRIRKKRAGIVGNEPIRHTDFTY